MRFCGQTYNTTSVYNSQTLSKAMDTWGKLSTTSQWISGMAVFRAIRHQGSFVNDRYWSMNLGYMSIFKIVVLMYSTTRSTPLVIRQSYQRQLYAHIGSSIVVKHKDILIYSVSLCVSSPSLYTTFPLCLLVSHSPCLQVKVEGSKAAIASPLLPWMTS
jgi:hypothetical protein